MTIRIAGAAVAAVLFFTSARAADPAPRQWVFIDPATGAIQRIPPLDSLQVERPDGIPGIEPQTYVTDAGFELIDTRHLLHVRAVRLDADGHVEATCRVPGHVHPVRDEAVAEEPR